MATWLQRPPFESGAKAGSSSVETVLRGVLSSTVPRLHARFLERLPKVAGALDRLPLAPACSLCSPAIRTQRCSQHRHRGRSLQTSTKKQIPADLLRCQNMLRMQKTRFSWSSIEAKGRKTEILDREFSDPSGWDQRTIQALEQIQTVLIARTLRSPCWRTSGKLFTAPLLRRDGPQPIPHGVGKDSLVFIGVRQPWASDGSLVGRWVDCSTPVSG